MTQDRRSFLQASAAAASAAALGGCVPDRPDRTARAERDRMEPALLRSVAVAVLPTELGDAGRERAVSAFEGWAYAYRPAAELNHGYGTAELRYAGADPVPGWAAQLRALDIEAGHRFGKTFASLDVKARADMLRRQIDDRGSALPSPLRARHVAVALMAHWFASPEATDRCYGVRISPHACRGIGSLSEEPESIS